MLAIRASSDAQPRLRTAHLLPCRIHRTGPVRTSPRYWDPKLIGPDGKPEAYFRGRRLKGRAVRVPEGYKGVVVEEGGRMIEEGMEGREEEVRALEEVARFEELVVWGHEIVPEEDDVFVKGVEEWISFATAIHTNDDREPIPPPPDESRKENEGGGESR